MSVIDLAAPAFLHSRGATLRTGPILTMDRGRTAVLTGVSAGRTRP